MQIEDHDIAFATALNFFLKNKPKKSFTQKRVAEAAEVTQSFISRLQKGKVTARETTKRKIAAVYSYDGSKPGKTYDDFLQLGRNLLITARRNDPKFRSVDSGTMVAWEDESAWKDESAREEQKITLLRKEHKSLIDEFPDPQEGYDINKKLLAIKRLDPERFDHIKEYIDLMYGVIESKKIAGNDSE